MGFLYTNPPNILRISQTLSSDTRGLLNPYLSER